jgi:propionyl-CoA synthetase
VDYDAVIYGSEEVPCVPPATHPFTFCILQEQLENQRVVQTHGGYAIALKFSMQKIYNIKEGVLGSIRCGLGSRPQLYRLWSFNQ